MLGKAIIPFAAAALLCAAALPGCGSEGFASAPSAPSSEESATVQEQDEDELLKQQFVGYVTSDEAGSLTTIGDDVELMLDAAGDGDYETAMALKREVDSLVDGIIAKDDVPEIADDLHGEVTDAALAYREVAQCYLLAAANANTCEGVGFLEDSVEHANDATDHVLAATDEMKRISDELGIDTGSVEGGAPSVS